jgi:hypothetical protein
MIALKHYENYLIKKPIITKCVTSFITFGLGDLICQKLEAFYSTQEKNIDWRRSMKQATLGFIYTPVFHFQFTHLLPYLFPPTVKYSVIKCVVFDQTVNASLFTTCFFLYFESLSGKNLVQAFNDSKPKILPTLIDNWKVWPLAMAINFKYVPIQFRVLFTNFCGMIWLAYLSYVQNVKNKK